MNNNSAGQQVRPIRLAKLGPGSTCRIFAEPSRNIKYSDDNTVYRKDTENTVLVDVNDDNHVAILAVYDLVVPLSRPKNKYRGV